MLCRWETSDCMLITFGFIECCIFSMHRKVLGGMFHFSHFECKKWERQSSKEQGTDTHQKKTRHEYKTLMFQHKMSLSEITEIAYTNTKLSCLLSSGFFFFFFLSVCLLCYYYCISVNYFSYSWWRHLMSNHIGVFCMILVPSSSFGELVSTFSSPFLFFVFVNTCLTEICLKKTAMKEYSREMNVDYFVLSSVVILKEFVLIQRLHPKSM